MIKKLAAAALMLALSFGAQATPVYFNLSGSDSSVDIAEFDKGPICVFCGVSASLSSNLGSQSAWLDVGDSFTFNFFTLNFYGLIGGGTGTIEATLGFDSPSSAPDAEGTGEGGFFTLFGALTAGALTWDAIDPFTLADGTSYLVSFEDLHGIDTFSTTVHGTITLLASGGTVNVPEPATLSLFDLGLLALGFAARRRKV